MRSLSSFFVCVFLASSAFSSAEDTTPLAPTLLSKSHAVQSAFLQREQDYHAYLLNIKKNIEGGRVDLNAQDSLHQVLLKRIEVSSEGRAQVQHWVSNAIAASEHNIKAQDIILRLIQSATSGEALMEVARQLYAMNENYISNRARAIRQGVYIPCTSPDKIETHDPLNRQVAQNAIDRQASYVEMIKDAYTQLLQYDPQEAAKYIENIGPTRLITQYVLGESDCIPDPTTSMQTDFAPPTVLPIDDSMGLKTRMNQISTRTRKERRAQARKHQKNAKKGPAHLTPKKVVSVSTSPYVQEMIRRAVEKNREAAVRKEEERVLKAQKAQDGRVAFERLREEYQRTVRMQIGYVDETASVGTLRTAWSAPEVKVRQKTRGERDPAYAQMSQETSSSTSSSSSAPSSSSQADVQPTLTAGVMKRLEAFWETKAGLTYHEVASLFKALGGRIGEKRGGSSHVTLSFYAPDGTKLKHELWRPHGSGNTFGFRTMESLHGYFGRCGFDIRY